MSMVSLASYTAMILVVNMKIVVISRSMTFYMVLSIILSVFLYYLWLWIGNYDRAITFVNTVYCAHSSLTFYLIVLMSFFVCFMIDHFIESF